MINHKSRIRKQNEWQTKQASKITHLSKPMLGQNWLKQQMETVVFNFIEHNRVAHFFSYSISFII